MTDARSELEAAIDAVIDAAVAAETNSMRCELDALDRWMKGEMKKLQARSEALVTRIEALMREREATLRVLENMVGQVEVDNVAETRRTLN